MSLINPYILEEILKECINDAEALEKFMLASKQTFIFTLNYFSRTKIVETDYYSTYVFVGSKKHLFTLNFLLFERLFKRILNSTEKFTISRSPYSWDKYNTFKDFIIDNKLSSCRDLVFENVIMDRFLPTDSSTASMNFSDIFRSFFQKPNEFDTPFYHFPTINNFKINGTLKACNVTLLLDFISTSFPQLESIDISLNLQSCSWKKIKSFFPYLNPSIFAKIPSKLKGTIIFETGISCRFNEIDDAFHLETTNNLRKKLFKKIFEIKNGLILNLDCVLYDDTYPTHYGFDYYLKYFVIIFVPILFACIFFRVIFSHEHHNQILDQPKKIL